MPKQLIFRFLAALVLSLSSAAARADDSAARARYFEKNFARDVFTEFGTPQDAKPEGTPREHAAPQKPEAVSPPAEAASAPLAQMKVTGLGVIVNTSDAAHALNVLEMLLKVVTDRSLDMTSIYMIGNNTDTILASPVYEKIRVFMPARKPRKSVPREYPVQHSPSWLLSTERGEIVVEGHMSPSAFIDDHNLFVTPPPLAVEK